MPSSRYEHISDLVGLIQSLQPTSLLDVGCGFGRWGFLAREFLDIFYGRYEQDQWQLRLDAVEIFPDYIKSHHRYIYNHIFLGDIQSLLPELDKYDVIIAGDVIEHLEKDAGIVIVQQLRGLACKGLIVAIPIGNQWSQEDVFGNPNEKHRSIWQLADLRKLDASAIKVYRLSDHRPYAVALWAADNIARGFIGGPYSRILNNLRSMGT